MLSMQSQLMFCVHCFVDFVPRCPWSFICPISNEVMKDPVLAMDGYSYDRLAIHEWFVTQQNQGKTVPESPKTGQPLVNWTLLPNHGLRESINEFRERYPNFHKVQNVKKCLNFVLIRLIQSN